MLYTGSRGRTDTPKERDFESRASANSAIPARLKQRRDLNPRPPPWQGGVLPLNYCCVKRYKKKPENRFQKKWRRQPDLNRW